jgi:hypothetical protein
MKLKKEISIAVFILIFAQMFPTYGISISVSGNAGGFSEVIQANVDDQFTGSTILTSDSLSDTTAGSGSIKKHFFSNPSSIGSAEVGFDIKNAKSYSYDHYADPDYFAVGDNLDVSNADKITAYASAHNSRGDSVSASTTVSGTRNGASLHGYSSSAIVWQTSSNIHAKAKQGFESASGDVIQTNEWAKDAEGDAASSRLSVIKGSLDRYGGDAYAAMDLYHDYDPEFFYESDQAFVTNTFSIPFAAKIQSEENARNAKGYTAGSGITVNSGSVDLYYGATLSGSPQVYGGNGPYGEHSYANAYNEIYGLSGEKIQANEKTTDIMGYTASSQTDITKGSMDSYRGNADASFLKKGYPLSPESRYASTSHRIDNLTGIKAQIDERAFDTKGIFTSTSISLRQGSIMRYSGNATANFDLVYPSSGPSGKHSYATAYNEIYGLSGAKIQANEKATNIMGYVAISQTDIAKGSMDSYRGSADASLLRKGNLLNPVSGYASISHSIDGLTGTNAQIDELAFGTRGIFTGTRTSLRQGSIGRYSGNATASLDKWVDPLDRAFAQSYSQEISGKELNLRALAINAEGIIKHNSTKLKMPANINYENRAEVNFGIPSVNQSQM